MKKETNFYESFTRTNEIKIGSSRVFGLVFSFVFVVVSVWPLFYGEPARSWGLWIAASFFLIACAWPVILNPLNKLWYRFGLLLHRLTNPIIMGLLFATTIIPTGLILRAAGKDPLQKKFDKKLTTYWVSRDPSGPAPETMKNQF